MEVSLISSPLNVLDVITVVGKTIFPCLSISFATSIIESSIRDFPTLKPEAFKKVLAIPPPTIM